VAEAQRIAPVVCVQNLYNLAQRKDDGLVRTPAQQGIAYVPYFPLGGFTPLESSALDAVAAAIGATPMQVALAWLLQRSPNILLIPGTSSLAHLRENLAARELVLTEAMVADRRRLVARAADALVHPGLEASEVRGPKRQVLRPPVRFETLGAAGAGDRGDW
jgi:pyridoxine 4-dehydrogenase